MTFFCSAPGSPAPICISAVGSDEQFSGCGISVGRSADLHGVYDCLSCGRSVDLDRDGRHRRHIDIESDGRSHLCAMSGQVRRQAPWPLVEPVIDDGVVAVRGTV
jgi:hypothetical protein